MVRTILAEYNPQRNSIDVYTNADYILTAQYRCGWIQKILWKSNSREIITINNYGLPNIGCENISYLLCINFYDAPKV